MSRSSRLLSNTVVFTVGKFLSKLLVFFMMRLYTASLTTAEYSTADLITNMANLLIPLACLGIGEGIFRFAADKSGNKEAFFTNGLVVLGFGLVGFLCLSPLLSLLPFFETTAWLIVLYVVASNIHAVVSQYLCAIGRTKLFAGQGLLNTALTVLLNILFLPVLDLGVTGYVLSIILADALTTVFLIVVARLWRAFQPHAISKKVMGSMLRFCLPLIPTTVFWWITGVSDRYLVSYICSEAENGLYAAAYKVPTLLIYVVSVFDSAWKLSVSEDDADENIKERTDFFSRVWRMYTTLGYLGGAVLMLTCRLFAGVLYADDFAAAWIYIPVLTLATVFTAFDTFLGSVYYAGKRTVGSMLTALCGAGVNVLLNLWWIPRWGAMGASIATLVSYFAVFVIRLVTTARIIPFKQEWPRWILNTALSLLLAGAVTLAEGDHGAVLWGLAAVLFVLIVAVNIKAIKDLLTSGLRMVRRR